MRTGPGLFLDPFLVPDRREALILAAWLANNPQAPLSQATERLLDRASKLAADIKRLSRGLDQKGHLWMTVTLPGYRELKVSAGVCAVGHGIELGFRGGNDESQALLTLLSLAKAGLLNRLRHCRWKKCRRWLFARQDRQWFCATGCRVAYFRSTNEGRKKRRNYMRQYRDARRKLWEAAQSNSGRKLTRGPRRK